MSLRKPLSTAVLTILTSAILTVSPLPASAHTAEGMPPEVTVGDGVVAGSTPALALTTTEIAAELRSAGDDCSIAPDGGSALCVSIEQEASGEAQRSLDPQVAPQAVVALPTWCTAPGAANRWYATRTAACGIFNGTLTVRQVINGAPTGPVTGTMNFLMYHYVYTLADHNVWANQIEVQPTQITGTAAGTQISGSAFCTGSCVQESQTFPVQVPAVSATAKGESYYEWRGARGQVGAGTPQWTLTFRAPAANNTAQLGRVAPEVRCDNAVPGNTRAGCVIPQITPWIEYDGTSFVEFGDHVGGAQASGLPGARSGAPLHRTTNTATINANRSRACPASLPRPSGKTCDEYPFASTREGAASSTAGARTQSWCEVALAGSPSTGAAGYSVCMINASENSQAGSLMNSRLFVPFRVLDGDAFHVGIVG